MSNILEVDSVILAFNEEHKVLSDVYLKVETGELIGILGRNGSGKSCLMNIIYGKLRPEDRSVRYNKKVIFDAYKHSDIIKYMPQFNFVPKNYNLKRIFKDFAIEFDSLNGIIPDFELYYKKPLKQLSGGLIRMIELFIILKSKSEFCMLDEPFSHLMPLQIETAKKLIQNEKKNKGIILTDHMYKDIFDISDRIYLIKDGKTHVVNSLLEIEKLGYARIKRKYKLS